MIHGKTRTPSVQRLAAILGYDPDRPVPASHRYQEDTP